MNRHISEHLYMSLDTRVSNLNNNVLVIGGTRSGKTFRFVKPQILSMGTSFVITDPKGELLRDCGGFLKKHGYEIRVLNLLNAESMESSNHYNPFEYIRTGIDIEKLIQNMISNTTPKGSSPQDPFWQDAETMLWQALFYYVWEHEPPGKKNIPRVLELLAKAEFEEDSHGNKKQSELDRMFDALEKSEEERMQSQSQEGKTVYAMDPAVTAYNQCMRGAADTVRTIIMSANARLACLKSREILELLSDDEMDIREIGCGRNYDGHTKTALFCVIPDNDKTFNFLIGMLYSQIFQELYYQADFRYGGKLPVHVTFLLDEFCNVALPEDFCSLLSTMASREISSVIIIQNIAQIQALFDKTWQTIPGNCCTLVYLGGNEQESHKYISEALGKATIRKRSNGVTTGRQGSGSRNYDEVAREIMLPDEVRRTDGNKCIVLIQGYQPVLDEKIHTVKHPLFLEMDGMYVHQPKLERQMERSRIFMHPDRLNYLQEEEKRTGKRSVVIRMEDLLAIPDEMIEAWKKQDVPSGMLANYMQENEQRKEFAALQKQLDANQWEPELSKMTKEQVLTFAKLKHQGFSMPCIREMMPFLEAGMSFEELMQLFAADSSPEEIGKLAVLYGNVKK